MPPTQNQGGEILVHISQDANQGSTYQTIPLYHSEAFGTFNHSVLLPLVSILVFLLFPSFSFPFFLNLLVYIQTFFSLCEYKYLSCFSFYKKMIILYILFYGLLFSNISFEHFSMSVVLSQFSNAHIAMMMISNLCSVIPVCQELVSSTVYKNLMWKKAPFWRKGPIFNA